MKQQVPFDVCYVGNVKILAEPVCYQLLFCKAAQDGLLFMVIAAVASLKQITHSSLTKVSVDARGRPVRFPPVCVGAFQNIATKT
jgi:hypothetical protein